MTPAAAARELTTLAARWEHNAALAAREHADLVARVYAGHARTIRTLATQLAANEEDTCTTTTT